MSQKEKIKVIAVVGPTASGKTETAIHIAEKFDGEIVSADSMQIYKYMDIGVAKPTKRERSRAVHHLMDFLEPSEKFSVAQYVDAAKKCIADISARGKTAIIAGGTGLYVDSLLDGVEFGKTKEDPELRKELRDYAERYGNEKLLEILEKEDPEYAAKLHPNNVGRIIRAIEAFRETGETMSERTEKSRRSGSGYDALRIGISFRDREVLYRRIEKRVDDMMAEGLIDEARKIRDSGMSATAVQAIGYKELFDYFDGKKNLEESVEDIKRGTRRYAKRQLTWFRRNESINWIYRDDFGSAEEFFKAVESITEKFLKQ